MAVSVASALVLSQFDYAISVLFGCPQKHTAHLQRAQHALARVMTQQHSGSSSSTSTELLKQLHWLPIEWHIRFKLASLTFKTLHTGHPPYLADLLQYHKPTNSTRSSASHLLSLPRHNVSFGTRTFRISAPKIWNSLLHQILQSQTLDSFRRHLKTYYFQLAYHAHHADPQCALALYKSLPTYLLTYLLINHYYYLLAFFFFWMLIFAPILFYPHPFGV